MVARTISDLQAETPVAAFRARDEARLARCAFAQAHAVFDPAYRSALDLLSPEIRQIAGYHAGYWGADGARGESPGKAVRPALALVCARAAGGGPGAGTQAAVAVELVHDFSLLHDDVMDGDQTRRHRPAVWTVYGVGRAVLVGDALLALAVHTLGAGPRVPVLTRALLELCEGQSDDLGFEGRSDVGLRECLAMSEGKTGSLLGAACELGALEGGAEPEAASLYGAFGRDVGLAFQLVDDLLGIWGDPQSTGKPAGSDLVARKKSLPVVAALASDTPEGRELSRLYQRDGDLDEDAVALAARLVEEAGGRAWAQEEAARRTESALAALDRARPTEEGRAHLRAMVEHLIRRNR